MSVDLKNIEALIKSRMEGLDPLFDISLRKTEAEGGCGVIGIASTEKIRGKHLFQSLCQMRNRGNGKGGGIAAAGLSPEVFGISSEVLENNYLLAIAYLDQKCRAELERDYIHSIFEIDHIYSMPHLSDYKTIKDLEVCPPHVIIYFVRVKKEQTRIFQKKFAGDPITDLEAEDEIVYQNTYRLNRHFYATSGEKRAFVLSNGKNMLVLKMVGYGDDVIRYYQLEDFCAHVWIGHHRYPTKGKVWHPGGAHPFVGVNEALVHNGDFANYSSLCEYLSQRNIHPLFFTDTEVSVLLFDLLYRTYKYPLEYVIEALAPTTERDFYLLPENKQKIYKLLQNTHLHASPDGPWFFLIAQSVREKTGKPAYRLIGITDTSMLRPQVFALQRGAASIGLAASEKQGIDAVLKSLSQEGVFWPCADEYWNARGGSYTDGGAFSFTIHPNTNGKASLVCSNKFGTPIHSESPPFSSSMQKALSSPCDFPDLPSEELFSWVKGQISNWSEADLSAWIEALIHSADTDQNHSRAIETMTLLLDKPLNMGNMRQSYVRSLFNRGFASLVRSIRSQNQTCIINAEGFLSEGEGSLALELVKRYKNGCKKFILVNCHGQRFIGNGLGPKSDGVQIDVYGSSGDYLGSGIDGARIVVHGSGQDQLAQIMKSGSLIVYGDVGQTFMYGAKGGTAFIKGNAAGRPLINAVGKPRVVINGTCLDYLAESFMAGNPLDGGGFVILNGLRFDEKGCLIELETPYPGSNLFSLASGGAIYIRDPKEKISKDQLNGGEFTTVSSADWDLIHPYLEENAKLFDISIARLLECEGRSLDPHQVYRKIRPTHTRVLQEEEAWVKGYV